MDLKQNRHVVVCLYSLHVVQHGLPDIGIYKQDKF